MPFQIIRNDITKVHADAIVNTANPAPIYAGGTDAAIYTAAGAEQLLAERRKIGAIKPGEVAVTSAFGLKAGFIIHTVGPVWQDGRHGEFEQLASCYRKSLLIALQLGCKSIAFPLISTGVYGFPKDKALEIALREISAFLEDAEMEVTLVVFDRKAFELSASLTADVQQYIDEHYVSVQSAEEYDQEIDRRQNLSGGKSDGFYNARARRERDLYNARARQKRDLYNTSGGRERDLYDACGGQDYPEEDRRPAGRTQQRRRKDAGLVSGEKSGESPSFLRESSAPYTPGQEAPLASDRPAAQSSLPAPAPAEGSLTSSAENLLTAPPEDLLTAPAEDLLTAASEDFLSASEDFPTVPAEESAATSEDLRAVSAEESAAASEDFPAVSAEESAAAEAFTMAEGKVSSCAETGTLRQEKPSSVYASASPRPQRSLQDVISHVGETFQECLLRLIDERGYTDTQVYKRANIDRKLFSKIRCNADYTPSRKTAISLAVALELNLDEMTDLLRKAGIALSPGSKFDLIIRYCVENRIYDPMKINALLFDYGQPLLGAG